MKCVEWEPGRRFGWDGPPLPWYGGAGRPRGYFEVTEAAPGESRLVCCFRPKVTGSMALLAPYMKRWLCKQRTADAARLKALLESEQASQAPVEAPVLDTEQATETPAHIPLWQDLLYHTPRRPRKGLPAVALGFGLGLIVMGGLWLLYPANWLVWAIMVPCGGTCIVWAVFPQD